MLGKIDIFHWQMWNGFLVIVDQRNDLYRKLSVSVHWSKFSCCWAHVEQKLNEKEWFCYEKHTFGGDVGAAKIIICLHWVWVFSFLSLDKRTKNEFAWVIRKRLSESLVVHYRQKHLLEWINVHICTLFCFDSKFTYKFEHCFRFSLFV